MKRAGTYQPDTIAICYLVRSRGSTHQQSTFSLGASVPWKIDAPDEPKEVTASLAYLGKALAKEVFPGIVPDSSMAIISRSNEPQRANL
ncbi:hypothetical protein L0F63_005576, partial [Massospora cicadina]